MWQHHEAAGVHHFVCGASGADPRHGDGLYRGWEKDVKIDWVSVMCVPPPAVPSVLVTVVILQGVWLGQGLRL
jgi:hypothetical protein